MSFFSKKINTNNNSANLSLGDNSQKVALRTMQQDLAAAKESGAEMNSVIIESIGRHRNGETIDTLNKRAVPPPAPRELPRLAEAEHTSEEGDRKIFVEQLRPDLSSISITPENNLSQKEPVIPLSPNFASADFLQKKSIPPAPKSGGFSSSSMLPEELLNKEEFYPQKQVILNNDLVPFDKSGNLDKEGSENSKDNNISINSDESIENKDPDKIKEDLPEKESLIEKFFAIFKGKKIIKPDLSSDLFKEEKNPKINLEIELAPPIPEISSPIPILDSAPKSSSNYIPEKNPEPEIAPAPVSFVPDDQKEKKIIFPRISKKSIYIIIGALAIIIIAAGAYFVLNNNKNNQNPPIDIPAETPIENPEMVENKFKLLNFESVYDLDIDFDTFNKYDGNIQTILAEKISSKELEMPKDGFIDIQISLSGEFPMSNQLIAGIASDFPEPILSKAGEKYNLVAYMQGSAPRLGFIIEITGEEGLLALIKEQENTLPNILSKFYFDESEIGKAASENFIETEHSGAIIRYKNFPVYSSAIEYGIIDNYLIFSTSKDSMFGIVDYIQVIDRLGNSEAEKNTGETKEIAETKEIIN